MGKRVAVVLGMHRSGTSAVARALKAVGVSLGDTLIPPSIGVNDRGFWEDAEINALNIELLEALGHDWHTLGPIAESLLVGNVTRQLHSRAVVLLRSKLESVPIFGFKDPRLPRLLPFWKKVFEELDVTVSYVLAFRNPLSVVESLAKRDRFDPPKTVLLWIDHVLHSLLYSSGSARMVVDYDRLIDDPLLELGRISRFLGLECDIAGSAMVEFEQNFVDVSLRHSRFSRANLEAHLMVPESAKDLFGLLHAGARRDDLIDQPEAHDLLRRLYDHWTDWHSVLLYLDTCEQQIADGTELRAKLGHRFERLAEEARTDPASVAAMRGDELAREQHLLDLEDNLVSRSILIEGLRREIGERDRSIEDVAEDLAERDNRITNLGAQIEGHLRLIDELRAGVVATDGGIEELMLYGDIRERRIDDLIAGIAERDDRIKIHESTELARDRRISELTAGLGERDNRLRVVEQALGKRADRVAAMLEATTQLESRTNGLELTLRARDTRIAELAHVSALDRVRIGALERTVEALRESRSWRVTGPLRKIGKRVRWLRLSFRLLSDAIERRSGAAGFVKAALPVIKREGMAGLIERFWRGHKSTAAREGGHATAMGAPEPRALHAGVPAIRMRLDLQALSYRPLISVVVPTFNTPAQLLTMAVQSVVGQHYENWELCICDDGSTSAHSLAMLDELTRANKKIKYRRNPQNRGISSATNDAISMATGEFIALLDHDDMLTPDALAGIVIALNESPDIDVLYSDQDKVDGSGKQFEQFFKPDWSPDYFRRVMYVGHLLVFRRSLLEKTGLFDPAFDFIQDYELMLRLSERTRRIHHIPKVLYHWRAIAGSVALDPNGKSGIESLQVAAVAAHLARLGISATVSSHDRFSHRVIIEPPADSGSRPLVSIIIPTKDAPEHIGRCLDSIFASSSNATLEVILVDNGTTHLDALAAFRRHDVVVVPFHESFNFSRANNLGAKHANGEYLLFLNNDTEVVSEKWIDVLLFHLLQEDVVAVGPLLLYPDNTVQHAGVVLGCRGTADHSMRGFPHDSDGYAGSLSCTREVTAVTAACMMCRRADYEAVGGMNEFFATHYQDVDLCLRLTGSGRRILCVPQVILYHFESASRGSRYDYLDRLLLLDRWQDAIDKGDPYYNPNLSLQRLDYSLAETVPEIS